MLNGRLPQACCTVSFIVCSAVCIFCICKVKPPFLKGGYRMLF
jgi:hypothetical protein